MNLGILSSSSIAKLIFLTPAHTTTNIHFQNHNRLPYLPNVMIIISKDIGTSFSINEIAQRVMGTKKFRNCQHLGCLVL